MPLLHFVEDAAPKVALVAFLAHRFIGNPVPGIGYESLWTHLKEAVTTSVVEFAPEHLPLVLLILEDLLVLVLLSWLWAQIAGIETRGLTIRSVYNSIGGRVYKFIKRLPFVSSVVQKEKRKVEKDLEKQLKRGDYNTEERYLTLPEKGMSHDFILNLMKGYCAEEEKAWKKGKVSGAVYHGGENHCKLLARVNEYYSISNPLHADLWPSLAKFESECLAMAANMMHGDENGVEAAGTMTSGGTESIIMSCKTHREWGKDVKGITQPEIVVADTVHAAFDKACEMLCIKLVRVFTDKQTHRLDPRKVEKAITRNTVMIVGSAPQFPHGVIDPIEKLSKLAVKYNVGLHVDCCLGGFILPFAKRLNYNIPKFDFELPGVTAMSMDTHKYGYTTKGSSIILYRSKDIRAYQYFIYPEWPGGLYGTPSTAGSRNGAVIAQAWASMMAMGMTGYLKETDAIMKTANALKAGINKIDGLHVMGEPEAMVVAFGSRKFDVYRLCEKMAHSGWSLNVLAHPPCAHICVTKLHVGQEEAILDDLRKFASMTMQEKSDGKQGAAPIYGLAAAAPAGPLLEMVTAYLDTTLKA